LLIAQGHRAIQLITWNDKANNEAKGDGMVSRKLRLRFSFESDDLYSVRALEQAAHD
jgi:hypothetical protein